MCGIAGFYNPHDHYLKEKNTAGKSLNPWRSARNTGGRMTPACF